MLPLLVDGLIVVLLLVVLGRGVRLQRTLRDLRSGDGEIERLIAALDRASARAQAALDGLRQTTGATSERLAGQLASAQRLLDDLQFLTGRGEQAADRLEAQIRRQRPAAPASQTPPPATSQRRTASQAGRAGDRPRAHAQDAAMSRALARLRRVARPPLLAVRWRRSLPMLLMAALGALALAKLGLLAEDLLGRSGTGLRSVVEASPVGPGAAPSLGGRRRKRAAGADAGGWSRRAGRSSTPEPAPARRPEAAPAPSAATAPPTEAPAAGPPAAATPAAAAATPEPPADSSAAPDQGFDPSRLTASEIAILQQLAARRSALDQRARELDRKSALLETAAAGLDGQIAQLSELRTQIAAAIEQHDAAEDAKLKSLIKIYETMKPKAAADIFDRLEMPVLLRVVAGMREAKAADVLARMDPVRAKQVTTELAKRTKLLEPPAIGPAAMATAPPGNGG